jgi:uncharacterized membrane protein YkoI
MKRLLSLSISMLTVLGIALAGVFVGFIQSSVPIIAQENTTTTSPSEGTASMTGNPQQLKNISGSIPLQSTIGQALRSEILVSMSEAVTTAENTVGANSTVVGAFLSPLKGFLVYNLAVIGSNNTLYKVFIDPGNGDILHTSEGRQLDSFHLLMPGPYRHGKELGDKRGFGHGDSGQFSDWKRHDGEHGQGGGGFWHNK